MSPVYGLVLAGGRSSRMNADKALIQYHDTPQWLYAANILKPLVSEVKVSSNSAELQGHGFEVLSDTREIIIEGPMAGLLTAMLKYPEVAWLLLAVDMPYITATHLNKLISLRDKRYAAVVMRDTNGQIHPTLGIYEPEFFAFLLNAARQGEWSIKKVLNGVPHATVLANDPHALTSVDRPQQKDEALAYFRHLHKHK